MKTTQQKVGIVSTVKNSKYLEDWLKYHSSIGVDYFMLFFDDIDNDKENVDIAKNFNKGVIITKGSVDDCESTHYYRQMTNATVGTDHLKKLGCRWVFHIDDDELIYLRQHKTIQDLILTVDEETKEKTWFEYRLKNYEAIRSAEGIEDYEYFRREVNFWNAGYLSYGNGKAIADLKHNARHFSVGAHSFATIDTLKTLMRKKYGTEFSKAWEKVVDPLQSFVDVVSLHCFKKVPESGWPGTESTYLNENHIVLLHYPFNHFERFYNKCKQEGSDYGWSNYGIYKRVHALNRSEAEDFYAKHIVVSQDKVKEFELDSNDPDWSLKTHGKGIVRIDLPKKFKDIDNALLKVDWHMYVLECSDKSLYAGITTNIKRRVYEHNNTKKGAKYTRSRRPVKLLITEKFPDRSSASKAEAAFKKLKRNQKLDHVQNKAQHSNDKPKHR